MLVFPLKKTFSEGDLRKRMGLADLLGADWKHEDVTQPHACIPVCTWTCVHMLHVYMSVRPCRYVSRQRHVCGCKTASFIVVLLFREQRVLDGREEICWGIQSGKKQTVFVWELSGMNMEFQCSGKAVDRQEAGLPQGIRSSRKPRPNTAGIISLESG